MDKKKESELRYFEGCGYYLPAKFLSQIDLTDVKNTPFFTVEGKWSSFS